MRAHLAAATAILALALGASAMAQGTPQTAAPTPQSSNAAPTAGPSPAPASPSPSPTPAYRFVYRATPSPVTTPFPGPNAPEIDEIDLSDSVLIPPENIYGRVLTNPAVVSVSAQTMGATLDIPKTAPGVFTLAASIPDVPQFLRNRSFDVSFTATTTDGRVATVTLELVIK
jgi:hypothetical protein